MKAKFFDLSGVIFLVRLQGKFKIDHSCLKVYISLKKLIECTSLNLGSKLVKINTHTHTHTHTQVDLNQV